LRQQIAALKSEQAKPALVPTKLKDSAISHLNRGNNLFKEKRYQEALDEFLLAAKMDPKNAQAANNVGFMYSKLQRFDDSIWWTRKAIEIDPNRSVAYQNLGDLYYELSRPEEARPYYEKYLELASDKEYAATVRSRLGK
jgi:tetratricopeptide (TPR) repeat protein